MRPIDSLPEMSTPAEIADLARQIFGAEPRDAGVIHPAAVWREGERLRTLVIGPETPRHPLDAFSLALARARADAIITTGRILRSEPRLTHELQGPEAMVRGLGAWRKEHLQKPKAAISLVLTRGKNLDLDHPLFGAAERALILTTDAGHRLLRESAKQRGIEVVGEEEPGIRAALRWLRRRGAATISVEAGPSTSSELYRAPLLVNELLLSIYGAPELPEPLRGGDLPSLQQLSAQFSGVSGFYPGEGVWSFYRYFQ